ncbi:MAG: L-histidine N(alpha)-methyltransferase [Chlorobi bacterium]|nr:L-histidine N(alpha)-methyltransferase [Chlorobiota bacterium]
MNTTETKLTPFAIDVINGLEKKNKSLPSKYFYDEEGDRLFQQIMNMPEYYLTRCEFEILAEQRKEICDAIGAFNASFNLIEFGAGDGLKTKLLLKYLTDRKADFTYYPVDISLHILDELTADLQDEFPSLQVAPVHDDYFGALRQMGNFNNRRNVTLFLGSNIGNFHYDEAAGFLKQFVSNSRSGDMLLLGVDLQKDPGIISLAYDDPHGITAAFNLNLLRRMNNELGADFDLDKFGHYTYYEPASGEVLSFLISLENQLVYFPDSDQTISFEKNELVHTEISKKYKPEELEELAISQGLKPVSHFLDSKNYFTDTLFSV